MTKEESRLEESRGRSAHWKRWGPYLSERAWGTVREDYSPHGTAWEYLSHDHARSRAYRWGEDGIAGVSDELQRLCLSLAVWNGRDRILKERMFGLTNSEGNHGEDVKEIYYYLDATPTHSYLKMLYKYPQREFPYAWLVEENRRRGKDQPEFELLDTAIFDDDRYFDVFVEYAKASPDDILMLVTVHNRGPEEATIHLLPQLWFRNTWSWKNGAAKPELTAKADGSISANHSDLGEFVFHVESLLISTGLQPGVGSPGGAKNRLSGFPRTPNAETRLKPGVNESRTEPQLLFTDNETNVRRHYGQNDAPGCFKDAFHDFVIAGNKAAVNAQQTGTKAAAFYKLTIPSGGSQHVRLRLARVGQASSLSGQERNSESAGNGKHGRQAGSLSHLNDFDAIFEQRRREADEFYAELQKDITDPDARNVQRQAFAGMIWSKQFFYYDVPEWLGGDANQLPPPSERKRGRNREWSHLNNADIISMPDKWEYPWYAAWDLAFHCIPLTMVDAEFAKSQLLLLTREWYMHPNGQLPAYEWAFGDVNPPVHAC